MVSDFKTIVCTKTNDIYNSITNGVSKSFGGKCETYQAFYTQMFNASITDQWFDTKSIQDVIGGYRNPPELINYYPKFMANLDKDFVT